MKPLSYQAVIVGCGVAGLYTALHLPKSWDILLLSKGAIEESDSFLAQGGICVCKDPDDYQSFKNDTLKAGHYENNELAVDIMIRSSSDIIRDLLSYGVSFSKKNNEFLYTKEGAHSTNRILYYKDQTGKEITQHLLSEVKKRKNLHLLDFVEMTDLLVVNKQCQGIIATNLKRQEILKIESNFTVLATGGIGGTYSHSTNFSHLTGDAIRIGQSHGVQMKHLDYVQIHPTTLYQSTPGRRFLISESVRGEGAILLDKHMQPFTNELLPRDQLTKAILAQMQKDQTKFVYLSMSSLGKEMLLTHFPTIYERCLQEGYDPCVTPIPVVPAQHYFMGGIDVDTNGQTSMHRLFAVGETACNGVHGKNRLASNSLLESLVFAKRAAYTLAKLCPKETFCIKEVQTTEQTTSVHASTA